MDELKISLRILLVKFATAVDKKNAEDAAKCEADILNLIKTYAINELENIKEILDDNYLYYINKRIDELKQKK